MSALEPTNVVSVVLLLTTIVHDLTSRLQSPKYTQTIWQTLSSPFQNFLTLEDLEELPGPSAHRSLSSLVGLALLGLLQCAGWLACFVYALVSGEYVATVSLLNSLGWVRRKFFPRFFWAYTLF